MVTSLVAFTHRLSDVGISVDTDRAAGFLSAVRELGTTADQVYWAGRLTLLSGPDDFALYDRVFAICYGRGGIPLSVSSSPPSVSLALLGAGDAGADGAESDSAPIRGRASAAEVLRQKDFASLTGQERRELAAMMALLHADLPERKARRKRKHHRGPMDRRRTTAAIIAAAGEPTKPLHHRRSQRPRRVVLLIDISGSMEPYADALLRFGHALLRRRPGAVEVFTMGTRLTRVTRSLAIRDPERALCATANAIEDYSGGTRLGESLQDFLNHWGRRGTARGAVVAVFSDGWERGSVVLLGECAQQLKRLSRRLIWVNPHKAREGYRPVQGGIAAVAPHLDAFISGHSLAALSELLEVMSDA
jgi:uncharacterized protein with von Willebrand factor type A (vWA) domain